VGGIVDEGLKAPKKQSACLIASQSERLLTEERSSGGKRRDADASNLRSPDTSVGMWEGQSHGNITTFGGGTKFRRIPSAGGIVSEAISKYPLLTNHEI
jgi:hypothetical protein